ncbi:MAG: hypothetical protein WCQ44_08680, partial [Opitutaceae bacterium]
MKRQPAIIMFAAMTFFFTMRAVADGRLQHSAPDAGPVVGLIDEVREFYPDTKLDLPVKRLTVHTARNTRACVHIMITGLRGTETIAFSESGTNAKPTSGIAWFRMIDVPVLENTGLDRNTEKYSGKTNPYVIRRTPFRIYDPFRPVSSPVAADSASLALRMEVPIDSTLSPGEYVHTITLDFGDHTESLEFVVVVHRAMVPPVTRSTISYINWMNIDNICSAHGVEKWSEPFWAMLATYAQTMAG